MRVSSLLRLLLLISLLSGDLVAQGFRVTGMLSGRDGSPIQRGILSATLVGEDGPAAQTTPVTGESDERGHFVIPLPRAGVWKLSASARGFESTSLDGHGEFFTGVVVGKENPTVDVNFPLVPSASVIGFVIDEAGEPVRTACQVTLLMADERTPEGSRPTWQTRGTTRTDDRGHYEFVNLAPGRYQVIVQAQPWYAVGAPRRGGPGQDGVAGGSLPAESPLDMAYPLTWYPGVTDEASASVLTLQGGDTRQADLRLLPVPSIHLRIPIAPAGEERRGGNAPQIQLLVPGGGDSYETIRPTISAEGTFDIGGLAPGSYQVTSAGGDRRPSILRIGPGSSRNLDLSAAIPMVAVTVHLDLAEGMSTPQIQFVGLETGEVVSLGGGRDAVFQGGLFGGRDGSNRPGRRREGGLRVRGDRTVDLAPGRYEVRLTGEQGQYLTGLTASGIGINGRVISVQGGGSMATLAVHIAAGNGTIGGNVTLHQKPTAGAMVLLVPAMLGEAQSFVVAQRTQTNTDGSFLLRAVIPGRYILVAIDHGWAVKWSDPTSLGRYLMQGIPLDLDSASTRQENLEAQMP
jgi:hypothetical protein